MTADSLARLRSRLWDAPSRDLVRAARALRDGGPAGLVRTTARAARDARLYGRDLESRYRRWVEQVSAEFSRVPDAELFADVARAPRFLIIGWLPGSRPEEMEPLLRSLRQQPYPHWHLWLVGEEPIDDRTEERIYNRVPGEKRLHVAKRDAARDGDGATGGQWNRARVVNDIVAASPHTTHVGFGDPGDRVAPESLLRLTERIFVDNPDVLYTDEDQMTAWDRRMAPRLKPEWSPEFLLSYHYLGHLTLYRRDLYLAAGGLRNGEDGRLEYDLALRTTERASRVAHVAHVLCHRPARRRAGFRAVFGCEEGEHGAESVLRDALIRRGVESVVEPARIAGAYRVRPRAPGERRAVVIVAARDHVDALRRCVRHIERHTPAGAWELVIVDNASRENRTQRYLGSLRHRVIADPGPPNPARLLNVAARSTAGEILVFLELGTRVRAGWLEALLEALSLPGVGVAGGKLLQPGGTVRNAGFILGVDAVAGRSHRHVPGSSPGYLGSLAVIRNYSAASAALMAVNRDGFDAVGGFDETFATGLHDIDLCLRLGRTGRRTVVTPWCVAVSHEDSPPARPAASEVAYLRERWGAVLDRDPCYHPLLSRDREDFQMARWKAAEVAAPADAG